MTQHLTSALQKFNGNLWGYHIPIPDQVAEKFINGDNRRVLCKVNKHVTLNCALMRSKEYWFILVNKTIKSKLALEIDHKVHVEIEKDESTYGFPVPEELQVLLDQDDEGNKLFHGLTPGKQRSLIYIVGKVKNTDSRLNKALAIMHHLKAQEGKLDFKILNITIKEFNQRKNLF